MPSTPQLTSRPTTLRALLAFCLIWSLMTATSFLIDMLLWGRFLDQRSVLLIFFAAIAGFITAAIAWGLERMLTGRRPPTARFAAMVILLSIGTAGATFLASGLYTVQFFYADMEPLPTLKGFENLLFFLAAHGYSFAASTARLFLPLGVICLFLASVFYCLLSIPPRR